MCCRNVRTHVTWRACSLGDSHPSLAHLSTGKPQLLDPLCPKPIRFNVFNGFFIMH